MASVGKILKDLFASADTAGELVVRAYGKLPMYPEYRRLDCDVGGAARFTQWINQGWDLTRTRDNQAAVVPMRFWGTFPDQKEQVIASLWDSHDSGGRDFLFTFFLTLGRESLDADPVTRFAQMLGLWDTLEFLRKEFSGLAEGKRFDTVFRTGRIQLSLDLTREEQQSLVRQAEAVSLKEFAAEIAAQTNASDLESWLKVLAKSLARWQRQTEAREDLAVRCPISGHRPLAAQALAWILWFQTNLEGQPVPTASFLPQPDQARNPAIRNGLSVVLLFRDLTTKDFQLTTTWASGYEYVDMPLRPLSELSATEADDPKPINPELLEEGKSLWAWAQAKL